MLTSHFPEYEQHTRGDQLSIYQNPWGDKIFIVGVIAWFACLIIAFVSLMKRNWVGFVPLFWAIGICVSPFIFVGKTSSDDMGSLSLVDSIKDVKGNEYHLLGESVIRGHKLVLAKVASKVGFEIRYKILAQSGWTYYNLCLVRPESNSTNHCLYMSIDQVLVGSDKNHGFLAYDLRGLRECSIRDVSNFILIGPNDIPSEPDFQDLLHCKDDAFCKQDALRKSELMKVALNNPNEMVRLMAARYLKSVSQ